MKGRLAVVTFFDRRRRSQAKSQPLLRSWPLLRGFRDMRNGCCTGGGSGMAFECEYINPALWTTEGCCVGWGVSRMGAVAAGEGGSPAVGSMLAVRGGGMQLGGGCFRR